MLNELLMASRALDQFGVELETRHQDLYAAARQSAVEVRIDAMPSVSSVGWIAAEEMQELWNLRDGKQNSFPVVKPKVPLHVDMSAGLRSELESLGRKRKARMSAILAHTAAHPSLDPASHGWWAQRERRLGERLAQLQAGSKDSTIEAFAQLAQRFRRLSLGELLEQLDAAIRQGVATGVLGEESFGDLEELLVGHIRRGRVECTAQLAFDVDEVATATPRVLSASMGDALSRELLRVDRTQEDGQAGACALSGHIGTLVQGPFPSVKLPQLGETSIYSLFGQVPCHDRYGMVGSAAMPVSRDEADDLSSALRFLNDAEREGKTWRGFTIGKTEHLLLAYATGLPRLPELPIASLFSGSRSPGVDFAAAAATFFEELGGGVGMPPETGVEIITLVKIDDGRKGVAASNHTSVGALRRAVERWLRGCANLPPMHLPSPGERGRIVRQPRPLFPFAVPNILAVSWTTDGLRRTLRRGSPMPSQVALRFFLEGPVSGRIAAWVLRKAIQAVGPLVVLVGGAAIKGDTQQLQKDAVRDALTGVSLLALALHLIGIEKEEYVNSAAFLLGRTMRLADVLHAEYAKHVRGKGRGAGSGMPGRLIGNAQMATVLSAPKKALALLSERILLYQGWASTATDAGYGRWALKHLSETAEALAGMDIPSRPDDTFRAQALLGYLARLPGSQKDDIDQDEASAEVHDAE